MIKSRKNKDKSNINNTQNINANIKHAHSNKQNDDNYLSDSNLKLDDNAPDSESDIDQDNNSDKSIYDDKNDNEYNDDDQNDTLNEINYDNDDNNKTKNDNKCVYNHIAGESDSDCEDDKHFDDDNINERDEYIIVNSEDRITIPILTKFEKTTILADRTKHLILGAKPMLKNCNMMTESDIAIQELIQNKIPFIIERILPNGNREHWKLHELEQIN